MKMGWYRARECKSVLRYSQLLVGMLMVGCRRGSIFRSFQAILETLMVCVMVLKGSAARCGRSYGPALKC